MTVAQNPTLWTMAGLLFNMAGAGLLYIAFMSAAHADPATDRSEPWLKPAPVPRFWWQAFSSRQLAQPELTHWIRRPPSCCLA